MGFFCIFSLPRSTLRSFVSRGHWRDISRRPLCCVFFWAPASLLGRFQRRPGFSRAHSVPREWVWQNRWLCLCPVAQAASWLSAHLVQVSGLSQVTGSSTPGGFSHSTVADSTQGRPWHPSVPNLPPRLHYVSPEGQAPANHSFKHFSYFGAVSGPP